MRDGAVDSLRVRLLDILTNKEWDPESNEAKDPTGGHAKDNKKTPNFLAENLQVYGDFWVKID